MVAGYSSPERERLIDLLCDLQGESSQRDLAARLGVTQAAVNGWLMGKSYPNTESLEKIAAMQGLTLTDMNAFLRGQRPAPAPVSPDQVLMAIQGYGPSEIKRIQEACFNRMYEFASRYKDC